MGGRPTVLVAGDNLHESIIGLLPAGAAAEYFEDPGVFEVRINRYNEVVCDTFEGRKIIQNDSITGAFIDNLTAALTSANNVSRQMINDVVLPDGSGGIICLPPAVIDNTAAIAFRKNIALDKDPRR